MLGLWPSEYNKYNYKYCIETINTNKADLFIYVEL